MYLGYLTVITRKRALKGTRKENGNEISTTHPSLMGRNTSRTNSQIGGQPSTSSSSKLFVYFYAAENTAGNVMQSTPPFASIWMDVNLFRSSSMRMPRRRPYAFIDVYKAADELWKISRHPQTRNVPWKFRNIFTRTGNALKLYQVWRLEANFVEV